MVMFLYRDEYYNSESDDKGIAEVIVGKHRNGPTGKVQLAWMEQYTKFASGTPGVENLSFFDPDYGVNNLSRPLLRTRSYCPCLLTADC